MTANAAPRLKVSRLKRTIECARRSNRGFPVRTDHACNSGEPIAYPTNSVAKNMWMSHDTHESPRPQVRELDARQLEPLEDEEVYRREVRHGSKPPRAPATRSWISSSSPARCRVAPLVGRGSRRRSTM